MLSLTSYSYMYLHNTTYKMWLKLSESIFNIHVDLEGSLLWYQDID